MASTRYAPTRFADGSKYDDFDRNPKGQSQVRGFSPIRGSSLDAYNAMQLDRSIPAFYNPNRGMFDRKSAPEVANQLFQTGQQLNRDGGISPIGMNMIVGQFGQPGVGGTQSAEPTISQWSNTVNPWAMGVGPMAGIGGLAAFANNLTKGNTVFQPQAPAQDNGFAQRLAEARAAVEERKNMQAMQEQTRRDQFQRSPTTGAVNRINPYGTASATLGPPKGPATFEGVSRDDWFRGAANRQGQANKFGFPGMTMEQEIAARKQQQGRGAT